MVAILQGSLGSPRFSELEKKVGPALESLGASMTEKDEIEDLIRKSKDEVTAAEKTHFKLGLVTPDRIEIDTSGMREPISAIIGRLKDGIHATLRPEAAEILISAINWKSYYWIDEKDLVTTLEIIRKPSGELSASSRDSISSSGRAIDRNFPDDGTPLPADQVYPEHWRPLLKGLTLIPKDER